MSELLIIIGGGGQAKVIIDALDFNMFLKVIILDPYTEGKELCGIPIVQRLSLEDDQVTKKYIVAIGDNYKRWKVVQSLLKTDSKTEFYTSIHETAIVSSRAMIGIGSVICAGAIVGVNSKIGAHSIINTKSVVDHDCLIDDYVNIAPNVTLGGGVEIGMRSFIGISTTVLHSISIACDVVIGAVSFLNTNVKTASSIWFGRPAKFIRLREKNDPYL
jgi:sugar O-acyltransferase (sialic acid O-acetyltransferase NeuD family)